MKGSSLKIDDERSIQIPPAQLVGKQVTNSEDESLKDFEGFDKLFSDFIDDKYVQPGLGLN